MMINGNRRCERMCGTLVCMHMPGCRVSQDSNREQRNVEALTSDAGSAGVSSPQAWLLVSCMARRVHSQDTVARQAI